MRYMYIALTLALLLLEAQRALACTALCLSNDQQLVVAKSYDYHVGHGLLVENRRGVVKEALVMGPGKAARWESRYASITFNQYGRELPLSGMNEKGLVVEILWLSETRHPPLEASRETVNELQLIQYLLDRTATLQEALAEVRRLQVARAHAKVHYFICDAQGACATVEHIEGRLVVHSGATLPVRAITNNTYEASVRHRAAHLRKARGAPKLAMPGDRKSLSRFLRTAHVASATHGGKVNLVARAFAALDDVQQGDYTKWQIVYEPRLGRVHFRSPGSPGPAMVVTLSAKGCEVPVRVMDLLGTLGGKPRVLVPYSLALNQALVQKSFAQLGAQLPAEAIMQVARYPEATTCKGPAVRAREAAVLGALESYRQAMVARDADALEALVHPKYMDDQGTPSSDDDVDRATLLRTMRGTLTRVRSVTYEILDPTVSFQSKTQATVDARIEVAYELQKGRFGRRSDRNRFLLRLHQGRWLLVRGM